MATVIPVSGSFTEYAARFVDDSLAFALGWAYWWLWVTVSARTSWMNDTADWRRSSLTSTTPSLSSSNTGPKQCHNGAGY